MNRRNNYFALVVAILLLAFGSAFGQSVSDYAVRVSASVATSPAKITLSWPADPQATGYTLYRKTRDATSWGTGTALGAAATSYVDSNVAAGNTYEYRISKAASAGGANFTGEGYIYTGIQAPLVESRGKVILLVDNTFSASLAMELGRLQQDLAGDGWTVLRHDVGRSSAVPAVKALIVADYNADPANVKSLFLFGHVPVPYSGNYAPDGHPNHVGAWPADVYYADMNGTWTDSSVNTTAAWDTRNWNAPGDGKFDQSSLPSDVELQVGRVDLSNLPSFALSETELLRQYLNKDHNFRLKVTTAQPRGLVYDNFGTFNGEAFAVNGWRNFAPFFGADNTVSGDWLSNLPSQSYLWGYACGPGSWTVASGVATTADLATNDLQVVFTLLFGSYFGDWDCPDNFLRAPLAMPTHTLTSAWAGRPDWQFHHMALGETIGFSTRLSQNNSSLYSGGNSTRGVHVALMGDPTLRMHPVAPPAELVVTANGLGGVNLRWTASPDSVLGYHVYRAATPAGPFTRLTSVLLNATNYSDPLVSSNVYLVRAVKLEVSPSGSYYNPSQGIFQTMDATATAPVAVLLQPTNNAVFMTPTNIQLLANTYDPANLVTNIEFYANGIKVGEVAKAPYNLSWNNVVPGTYSLIARAKCIAGIDTNSSAVTIHAIGSAPQLAVAASGPGSFLITGSGNPGQSYQVQATATLGSPNWQTLATVTADASGAIRFTEASTAPQRYYRMVSP
jgi:Bacterial Ig domain